jgi:methylglutaconyl-CoA hydratase
MATRAAKKASPARSRKSAKAARASGASTVTVEVRDCVALLALSRPEVHNAFNYELINDLTDALVALDADTSVRAVVLLGAGRSFCAGADLNWMRETATYTPAQNLADARALARLLRTLDRLGKPTIARVHGPAYGGGVGLVACCDIAIASQDAVFAFSEAKLGIVPATISPYVIEAIGARHARRYFVSCERFTAAEAFRIGLVHELAHPGELDARINEILGSLLVAGPAAQAACKDLIRTIAHRPIDSKVIDETAKRIASVRTTPEAKAGIAAFLGKRSAPWVPAAIARE